MIRSDNWPLFVAARGEGENASVVTTMREARAWLREQFYGLDGTSADGHLSAEDDVIDACRWEHFSDTKNWSTSEDGAEYEYSGFVEDQSTIRAFFVTDVATIATIKSMMGL